MDEKTRFWIEPRYCIVLGLKPIGKPTTWIRKTKFWIEPRPCMVLGLKAYGETNYLDGKVLGSNTVKC